GGRITLDPGPKVGATFTVELPRGTRAPRLTPPPATLTVPRALRLLVVDDELPILHYMRATLESWGHAVEIASDGSEALERALARAGDVDQVLATKRGSELARRAAGEGVTVAGLPWALGLDPRAAWWLRRLVTHFRPHIIHVHDSHALALARWARAWRRRAPP